MIFSSSLITARAYSMHSVNNLVNKNIVKPELTYYHQLFLLCIKAQKLHMTRYV